MSVSKVVGRGLMGLGLLLMLIGTASVPSTSWAAAVGPPKCEASCNHCGAAELQADQSYKCLKLVAGVPVDGECDKVGGNCKACSGDCEHVDVDSVPLCKCVKL